MTQTVMSPSEGNGEHLRQSMQHILDQFMTDERNPQ